MRKHLSESFTLESESLSGLIVPFVAGIVSQI